MIDPFSIAKSTTNTPSNTYRYTDNRRVILTIKTVFATESQTQNERALFTKLPVVEMISRDEFSKLLLQKPTKNCPPFRCRLPRAIPFPCIGARTCRANYRTQVILIPLPTVAHLAHFHSFCTVIHVSVYTLFPDRVIIQNFTVYISGLVLIFSGYVNFFFIFQIRKQFRWGTLSNFEFGK